MKTATLNRLLLAGCALFLVSSPAWARLPVPYKHQGAIASIDRETGVIVLAEPAKPKFRLGRIVKPTTFVWNERTQFIKNGQPADVTTLASGASARLHYWYPPKRKPPFLVKVVWENGTN